MEQVIVNIGDKTYRCKVAKSDEDRKQGLMGVEALPPDEGMLLVWEEEDTREIWMKNTPLTLDIIGINDDDEVVSVQVGQPNSETLIPFVDTKYILEVNTGSGIVAGDEVGIDDSEDLDDYVMKVLAPDGSAQMLLQGGERILSRVHSKTLIKKVKKAYEVQNKPEEFDKKCKALGKYMFKVIQIQDTQEPQYVELPESKKS